MIEVGLDFAFKVKDDGSLRQDPPKKKKIGTQNHPGWHVLVASPRDLMMLNATGPLSRKNHIRFFRARTAHMNPIFPLRFLYIP
jgi:hypothetical protein